LTVVPIVTELLTVGSVHHFTEVVLTVFAVAAGPLENGSTDVLDVGSTVCVGTLRGIFGIAPVTKRSGQSTWIHWRWQAPTFLRQTFVEWAAQTINKSYWAGIFYHRQRAKGCSHQAAVRALAFKWIRILYRCWKTRTPYDETRYLRALQERGSPLLKTAEVA
jgi:hypothetical protein